MFYARIAIASVLFCAAPMAYAGERAIVGFDIQFAAMPFAPVSDYSNVAATPTPIIRTLPPQAEPVVDVRPIIRPRVPQQQAPMAQDGGFVRGYLESLDQ